MPAFGRFATVVMMAAAAVPLWGQSAPTSTSIAEAPQDLVRDVMYNELHDRERDSHWQYRSARSSSERNLVREQVETNNGPIFRLLELDGNPLDPAQQRHEAQRLEAYIHDAGQIARVERAHEEDETRLANVMQMLPKAFLFTYQGEPSQDVVRLAFRPNPAYLPDGYEDRIVHSLTGTLTVNLRFRRMVDMRGTVSQRVEFGYGFLGHVDQGGTFEIHRRQVSVSHWKTDLVDVHVQGKILMLKTVGKDQREVRSDFHPVPRDTTLAEARQLLLQTTDPADTSTEAELVTADQK